MRAKALYCAGYVANFQGDRVHGTAWSEAGLAVCREAGDDRGAAYALGCIGLGALLDGDAPVARAAFADAVPLFRKTGDAWGLRTILNGLGELERALKNFDRANELYTESLALARQEQDTHGVGLLLVNLALVGLAQGEPHRSRELTAEAIHVWTELDYRTGLVACIALLASIAAVDQQLELAIRLFSAWKAMGPKIGRAPLEYDRLVYEHYLGLARASLEASAFDDNWAAGEHLSLDQAIAEGLSPPGAPTAAITEPVLTDSAGANHEPLTIREWEVAQLVARGLTNRQIASELIVTEATATKHVENIRSKLELTSRTQVAAWVLGRTH